MAGLQSLSPFLNVARVAPASRTHYTPARRRTRHDDEEENEHVTEAEIARQQPTQLGVVLREGIVTALAGAFKVGAEVGRVAARATNDVLDAAGRMTTRAAQAPASAVQPEVRG